MTAREAHQTLWHQLNELRMEKGVSAIKLRLLADAVSSSWRAAVICGEWISTFVDVEELIPLMKASFAPNWGEVIDIKESAIDSDFFRIVCGKRVFVVETTWDGGYGEGGSLGRRCIDHEWEEKL